MLAAIVIGALPGSPLNKAFKSLGNITSPIQGFVKGAGNMVSDYWSAVTDGIAIRKENEEMKAEIARLQYQITQNEEAKIRLRSLRMHSISGIHSVTTISSAHPSFRVKLMNGFQLSGSASDFLTA